VPPGRAASRHIADVRREPGVIASARRGGRMLRIDHVQRPVDVGAMRDAPVGQPQSAVHVEGEVVHRVGDRWSDTPRSQRPSGRRWTRPHSVPIHSVPSSPPASESCRGDPGRGAGRRPDGDRGAAPGRTSAPRHPGGRAPRRSQSRACRRDLRSGHAPAVRCTDKAPRGTPARVPAAPRNRLPASWYGTS
jgi:hypothetical protein